MTDAVVIAGAGPVGLMLAYELGLAGVETIIVDRLSGPSTRSPGMAINSTVVELLMQRSLITSLQNDGMEFPLAQFSNLRLDPNRVRNRHPNTFVVPQGKLEQRLEEQGAQRGIAVRRGYQVVSLDQDESGISVELQSDGRTSSIRCRYLVGCDGADSAVRSLASIDFPGTESPFYGIIGDLPAGPNPALLKFIGAHQYPSGLFTVAPAGPDTLRVLTGEFMKAPQDPSAPVTTAELRARIERITGKDVCFREAYWLSRWNYVARHASTYREDRVFLAGDAAHVHFPLGGLALSTGIEDAVNLGWKLAADIHGWAPEGLLDTYHSERYPAGAQACAVTEAQVALMHPLPQVTPLRKILEDLIAFEEVNEYLVTMVAGLDVRYAMPYGAPPADQWVSHPLLGHRLPNMSLSTPNGRVNTSQLLSAGRGILLMLGEETLDELDVLGWESRIDIIRGQPAPEINATVLLLRPDGRVAWASAYSDASPGLQVALNTWFGRPEAAS